MVGEKDVVKVRVGSKFCCDYCDFELPRGKGVVDFYEMNDHISTAHSDKIGTKVTRGYKEVEVYEEREMAKPKHKYVSGMMTTCWYCGKDFSDVRASPAQINIGLSDMQVMASRISNHEKTHERKGDITPWTERKEEESG